MKISSQTLWFETRRKCGVGFIHTQLASSHTNAPQKLASSSSTVGFISRDFHTLISQQHSQTNPCGLYMLFLTSKSRCIQKISSVDALLTTQNVLSWSGRFGGGHTGWSQLQLASSVSPLWLIIEHKCIHSSLKHYWFVQYWYLFCSHVQSCLFSGSKIISVLCSGCDKKPWPAFLSEVMTYGMDGLVQDCSISSALAVEIWQYCTKPLICIYYYVFQNKNQFAIVMLNYSLTHWCLRLLSWIVISKLISRTDFLCISCEIALGLMRLDSTVNTGSGNGWVLSDNRPLPESMLTQFYVTI